MSHLVFNQALAKLAHYASLPALNDAFIMIPLESSGLESDAVLRDKDTFADVIAGTTNEQTTLGRRTLAFVTATIDDVNNKVTIGSDDVVWATPAGNNVGALVICYDPDTTVGTDASLIPLTKHDLLWMPSDGIPVSMSMASFFESTSTLV
jgi:hypothetical protein